MGGWSSFEAVAAARGAHPAVLMADRSLSFAELRGLALRMAGGLLRRGVGHGDRVGVHLANGFEAVALPLALWAVGATPAFLAPDANVEALAVRVGAALVVSDRLSELTAAPIVTPGALEGEVPVLPVRPGAAQPGIGLQDIGSIVFTSGTTGQPKGVMQRVASLLDVARRAPAAAGFGPEDRVLCAVPLCHSYGWGQLLAMYRQGLTLILAPPGLAALPEAVERHRATVFGGVPSAYAGLSRGVSDILQRDRSSVRLVTSTGSVMPEAVWHDLKRLFPAARRCLNYGLTETLRSSTLRPEDEHLAPSVVGCALPGVELCVVDEAGRVQEPGVWGEVVHRGAGVFEGYWGNPEATALRRRPDPVTGQGFAVFTGDRGRLDEAGRLTIADRMDRIVKVMGRAASPAAIEAVLCAVPGVEAAAVLARPHDVMGAELIAVLATRPDGGPQAIAAARQAVAVLPPYERPRLWLHRESLPLTVAGKVDLPRLLAEVRHL